MWACGPEKYTIFNKLKVESQEKSIRDTHTPQPGEIALDTVNKRRAEAVHRLVDFQNSVSCVNKTLQ